MLLFLPCLRPAHQALPGEQELWSCRVRGGGARGATCPRSQGEPATHLHALGARTQYLFLKGTSVDSKTYPFRITSEPFWVQHSWRRGGPRRKGPHSQRWARATGEPPGQVRLCPTAPNTLLVRRSHRPSAGHASEVGCGSGGAYGFPEPPRSDPPPTCHSQEQWDYPRYVQGLGGRRSHLQTGVKRA